MKNILKHPVFWLIIIVIVLFTTRTVMDLRNGPKQIVYEKKIIVGENEKPDYYTVQIGVYSNEMNTAAFAGISSLILERTNRGRFRYYSGIYKSKEEAIKVKDSIVLHGISDAFVTLYECNSPYFFESKSDLINNQKTQIKREFGTPPMEVKDIKYRVELGSYFESVPRDEALAILETSNKKIDRYKKSDGTTTYIIGSFKTLKNANRFRDRMIKKGLTNALVIGFFTP